MSLEGPVVTWLEVGLCACAVSLIAILIGCARCKKGKKDNPILFLDDNPDYGVMSGKEYYEMNVIQDHNDYYWQESDEEDKAEIVDENDVYEATSLPPKKKAPPLTPRSKTTSKDKPPPPPPPPAMLCKI